MQDSPDSHSQTYQIIIETCIIPSLLVSTSDIDLEPGRLPLGTEVM